MDDSFVLWYVCGPVHSANLMVFSSAGKRDVEECMDAVLRAR